MVSCQVISFSLVTRTLSHIFLGLISGLFALKRLEMATEVPLLHPFFIAILYHRINMAFTFPTCSSEQVGKSLKSKYFNSTSEALRPKDQDLGSGLLSLYCGLPWGQWLSVSVLSSRELVRFLS